MKINNIVVCLNHKCDHGYDSTEHALCPYCGESQSIKLRDYFKPAPVEKKEGESDHA